MTHVFLSYLREDRAIVDRLAQELRSEGIAVWLDRDKIMPGQHWKSEIRAAIEGGSYFIACFSAALTSRTRSYVHEELSLAIDELRRRPIDRSWFIPVLLEPCDIPPRSIGGGETLQDIQWVDLYNNWSGGVERLIRVLNEVTSLSETKASLEPKSLEVSYRAMARAMKLPQRLVDMPEVALKTLIEKPPAWDMLLLGQLLSDQIEAAQFCREELLFTPVTFENSSLEMHEVSPFVREEVDTVIKMMQYTEKLASTLTETFARAGDDIDPLKIVAFAERYGEIYSAALKWRLRIRDVCVPEILGDIMLQLSRVSRPILDAIEEFRDKVIWNFEQYSQLSAEERAKGYTMMIHVVIDEKKFDAFRRRSDEMFRMLKGYTELL